MYNFHSFEPNPSNEQISELLDKIVPINQLPNISTDKQLIAYGCGDLGRMCREFCHIEKIDISAYVDANYEKVVNDDYWNGENIQPLEFLRELDPDNIIILVCVVNYPLGEIFRDIRKFGFKNIVTFYDFVERRKTIYPLENGWIANQIIFDKARAKRIANLFKDDRSVKHYLSFLAWRFAREEWVFADAGVDNHNRFLIDEIKDHLSGRQVLIDIGAHIGSISIQFESFLGSDLERIYCFEPDQNNLSRLRLNLQNNIKNTAKYEIFEDILWSKVEEIRFLEGYNYASGIAPHGTIRTSTTLDSFELAPTIIKIHTEGSELDIIKGSLETIERTRPILMLTVYHNSQGIYETMEFLTSHLADYEFLFRNHSWAGTGAVVYCLPLEQSSI